MPTEHGLHRLIAFSDAVVAIAITLLVLPLADAASKEHQAGLGQLFRENRAELLAFVLSFAVIGTFWWTQHQAYERVRAYNGVLVWGMFLWLLGIVFLPFPTELLSTARGSSVAVHGVYIGTMLVTAIAAVVQRWVVVRWPDLQVEEGRSDASVTPALILAVLMGVALVVACAVPAIGLWALGVLALAGPLERLAAHRHRVVEGPPSPSG